MLSLDPSRRKLPCTLSVETTYLYVFSLEADSIVLQFAAWHLPQSTLFGELISHNYSEYTRCDN